MIRGLCCALLVLGACDKGGGTPADPRAAVLAAWKAGGLEPSALTPAKLVLGEDCETGTVGTIEVVLCVFATPEDAKAAEDPGLAWVGAVTGAVQTSGRVLIGIADRRKTDPSGRTINQLMKLAPK